MIHSNGAVKPRRHASPANVIDTEHIFYYSILSPAAPPRAGLFICEVHFALCQPPTTRQRPPHLGNSRQIIARLRSAVLGSPLLGDCRRRSSFKMRHSKFV